MNSSIYQQTKPVTGSNSLVMAIYKKTAPTTLVDSFPLPAPYSGQTQFHTFGPLQQVIYNYKLYESPDGSASGVVRNYFDIQPGINTYNSRNELFLVADISNYFVSGPTATRYGPDPSLVGWNWRLERVGQGTQQPGIQYVKTKGGVDTTIDDTDADGWRLAIVGDLIGPNEKWVIKFQPQLAASTSSSSFTGLFTGINVLSANTVLDNTSIGQCFWLKGGGAYFEVQLPDMGTVPDNLPIYFMSNGGSHVNVSLKCVPGQQIQWFKNQADLASGTRASRIVLGQLENLIMCKTTLPDSSKLWLIIDGGEGVKQVGEIVSSYSRIGINYLFLDGTRGLSKTTYARAWDVISGLDPSCTVPDAQWDAIIPVEGVNYYKNHGKFTDGGATFGVPKVFEYGFLRAINGTSGGAPFQGFPGDLQVLQFPTHTHNSLIGNIPTSPNGKGPVANIGNYNNQVNTASDLSSPPWNVPGAGNQGHQLTTIGNENRPSNFGVYMSMKI